MSVIYIITQKVISLSLSSPHTPPHPPQQHKNNKKLIKKEV